MKANLEKLKKDPVKQMLQKPISTKSSETRSKSVEIKQTV